ncbi:MAG TPA: vWA domain-containing protein [Polyangiaceae bacterium]|nr:vWA domain-containing protein [Polyangiaceae bacterium]
MQRFGERAAIGLVLAACAGSCSGEDLSGTRSGAGGGSRAAGGSTSVGAGGAGGIIGGAGGAGGIIGGAGGSSGGNGSTPDAACQAIAVEAENQVQPADIVFAIDNSGSMDEEAVWVQQNMNTFSQQIIAAKVDVHVVLISSYPGDGNGICVDPPLGAGGCPTKDTNTPSFLHVSKKVSSHDALELFVSAYPQYRSALRAGASKHFVVVTDDESDVPAATFTRDLVALDPTLLTGFKFHGIFSFTEGKNDQCSGFSAGEGKIYKELVTQTGGVSGDLCLQDFKPVFDRLARAVVGGSKLACEWQIPPPPAGKTFTPSQTNITYGGIGGQPRRQIPNVDSPTACANAKDGWAWFYDDNIRPTKITVCAQACAAIQADPAARIEIAFGCPTIIVPK